VTDKNGAMVDIEELKSSMKTDPIAQAYAKMQENRNRQNIIDEYFNEPDFAPTIIDQLVNKNED
jgi:hypothetical protein